jgi:hypothetical protein
MSSIPKLYRSTDMGAPTLTGAIPASTGATGSFINLLRTCGINGYNTQTASSVVVSSGVATFNCTSHGFLAGQIVLIAGATPSELNGEKTILAASTNLFTFASASGDQTATGTITAKMAPLGWTEPVAGATNLAHFKMASGNQMYLDVNETIAQVARVVGYESMTGPGSGTGPFPTAAQLSGGGYWDKSSTTDSTARAWILCGTDRHLFFHCSHSSTALAADAFMGYIGDLKTYHAGDAYHTTIIAGVNATIATNSNMLVTAALGTLVAGSWTARGFAQTGSAVTAGKTVVEASMVAVASVIGAAGAAYPHPSDSGLWLSRIRVCDSVTTAFRGELPGLWAPCHNKPLEHLDTFTGTGALAGRTFLVLKGYNAGEIMLETSNTWDM